MTGSAGQKRVPAEFFSRFFVPRFSREEQRALATVLDTMDEAIRRTEAVIAKLRQVKAGMLHDLLTRGLNENGELRPPQTEAPHLYKESPLGWIPREWKCKMFGDLCSSSAFGPRFPSDEYNKNGPLATLRTTDMDDEGNISLSTMPRVAIEPSVFADHLLRPEDIVISRSGITQMGLDVARRLELCAIGRATNRRFICYSAPQRLRMQPELAGPRLKAA